MERDILNELVDARDRNLHVEGFGDDEMSSLIDFICTS